jgi:hypothetical protein
MEMTAYMGEDVSIIGLLETHGVLIGEKKDL